MKNQLMRRFVLFLFVLPFFLSGCMGGGKGTQILNTTPRQDFFRLKIRFNKEHVSTDVKALREFLKELKKLHTKVDDPSIRSGIRKYLALVKNLQVELDFFKEKRKTFDHTKTYAPLKDAFRWCDTILKKDPSDLEAAYIMGRTCFNLARFADKDKINKSDMEELYGRGFKWLQRLEGLDRKFEATFKLGGHTVDILDVYYLRFYMRLSLSQPVICSHILENIYHRFSRTKKDPMYILCRALLEIKVNEFDKAMLTLAEFKTDEHLDFVYKNLGLHYLEELYKLKELYSGETFRDQLKRVANLKKGKKDFYSSGKFISLHDDPVASPITDELLTQALKDFFSMRTSHAASGFKDYLEKIETLDNKDEKDNNIQTNYSKYSRIDTLYGLITILIDRKQNDLLSGLSPQKLFEDLVLIDRGQEASMSALWLMSGYVPDYETARFMGLNLSYDRLNRLKKLEFELYFPNQGKDLVVQMNADDKGFRIPIPADPFQFKIKGDLLLEKIEPGIAILELYCKDSIGRTTKIPIAFPR